MLLYTAPYAKELHHLTAPQLNELPAWFYALLLASAKQSSLMASSALF